MTTLFEQGAIYALESMARNWTKNGLDSIPVKNIIELAEDIRRQS